VRSLSPEESELWARVAATIRPISRETRSGPGGGPPKAAEGTRSPPSPRPALKSSPPSQPKPKPLPIANKTLDGSWDRKLAGGTVDLDRVLDLHGLNLNGAWSAIDRGLEQAIARGDRVLLLITGHHRPGEPPVQRGKIRAAVHDWLAASRHASAIAAVRGAHRRHGGGGSLYIILKRKPPRR
jgi:DNA-nicking Smr family endonuclease